MLICCIVKRILDWTLESIINTSTYVLEADFKSGVLYYRTKALFVSRKKDILSNLI